MLYVFGFRQRCVVVGDVFFVDPKPYEGQEGAEAGVRVEIRELERLPLPGSVYSSQPLEVAAPKVRVDLFESFPDGMGRRDRVHYHPEMNSWEPGERVFESDLTERPLDWLRRGFKDAEGLVKGVGDEDVAQIAGHAEEIVRCVEVLWNEVRSGSLDPQDGWTRQSEFRRGWL